MSDFRGSRPRWEPYHTVLTMMALGWVSLYMVRMIFTPALPFIIEEYGISYAQAGTLATAVLWAYAVMQFPAGYLGDRIGRKPLLCLGILAWSLLCVFTSFAYSLAALFILRVLTGMAAGGYFGNLQGLLAVFTPKERWGMAQGVCMTGAAIGNFLGIFVGGLLAGALGWRPVFLWVGAASVLLSVLFFRYIPPMPQGRSDGSARVPFGELFCRWELWILYFIGFAVMEVFWIFATWTPSMLLDLGIGSKTASFLYASLFSLCGIPSRVLAGLGSDILLQRWGYPRKLGLGLLLILTAGLLLFAGYAIERHLSLLLFAVLIGLAGFLISMLFPPLYAMMAETASPQGIGATFGFSNFIAFVGATLAPILTGFIRDRTHSFAWSFYIGAIMIGAAAILTVLLPLPIGLTSRREFYIKK